MPPPLREIVRVPVGPLQFRRDDLFVHQLGVSSRKPINELAPVPFPIGGSSLVFGVYPFAVGVDVSFVTDQSGRGAQQWSRVRNGPRDFRITATL